MCAFLGMGMAPASCTLCLYRPVELGEDPAEPWEPVVTHVEEAGCPVIT